MLSLLTTKVGGYLAVIGAVLAGLFTLYLKGRSDGSAKVELKVLKENTIAISKADRARLTANTRSDTGGLREDDGFKRNSSL